MELNELLNAISSVGFPIAMCMYMIYSNNKTIKELSDTIDSNTTVMKQILEHFRDGDHA